MMFEALITAPMCLATVVQGLWNRDLDLVGGAIFAFVFLWAWFGLGVAAGQEKAGKS
jgi:hypothetical protein